MFEYLLHLWSPPPRDLPLSCPPPADGQQADPSGFYDASTVHAAFDATWTASLLSVLVLLLVCYLATSQTTGRSFGMRWILCLAVSVVLGFVAPFAVLTLYPTHALAGSCETNPEPFALALPTWLVLARSVAGAVWGPLAFFVLSLGATKSIGLSDKSGGFFHNRGVPHPWFFPSRG
jgi:hypothetical protein